MKSVSGRTVSEYFGVLPSKLQALGVYNSPVDCDAEFFIDPRLLAKCAVPEFEGATKRAYEDFATTIGLVARSSRHKKLREAALERLEFKEVPGVMLGTSETCHRGRGVAGKLASNLFETMNEFIEAGLQDESLLGVMVVVQDGFGPDRISDMLVRINLDAITKYSARIFKELEISGEEVPVSDGLRLPMSPCGKHPVLLVPRNILRPIDGADAYRAWFGDNDTLRRFFSREIQAQYEKYQSPSKSDYRQVFLKHPEKFGELGDTFRNAKPDAYDFAKDPKGLQVTDKALEVAISTQLPIRLANPTTPIVFKEAVIQICEHFRQEAERSTILRDPLGNSLPEKSVQGIFRAVASSFARQLGIDLNAEPNNGRGPVDFKLSLGSELRSLVEVKLASNGDVVKGYSKQLKVYREQEPNSSAVYLVVGYEKDSSVRDRLRELAATEKSGAAPHVVFVDASVKPSASKVNRT